MSNRVILDKKKKKQRVGSHITLDSGNDTPKPQRPNTSDHDPGSSITESNEPRTNRPWARRNTHSSRSGSSCGMQRESHLTSVSSDTPTRPFDIASTIPLSRTPPHPEGDNPPPLQVITRCVPSITPDPTYDVPPPPSPLPSGPQRVSHAGGNTGHPPWLDAPQGRSVSPIRHAHGS